MAPRVDPILDPQCLLAHIGSFRQAEPGSLAGYELALRLGADGVIAEARREGSEVLLGPPPRRLRRRTASEPLDKVLEAVAPDGATLAVVVDSEQLAEAVVGSVADGPRGWVLWLVSADLDVLGPIARRGVAARILHATDPQGEPRGAEAHAARLREMGVDGVLVPEDRTGAGLTTLMHRFTRIVLAAGADYERTARRALSHGVDGVSGADVEVLRSARDGEPRPRI